MADHELKTWVSVYPDVASGAKTVEIRRADRDFQVGDTLHLNEFDPDEVTIVAGQVELPGRYTGRRCVRIITHVLPGGQFGLEPGYVALSIREPDTTPLEHRNTLDGAVAREYDR